MLGLPSIRRSSSRTSRPSLVLTFLLLLLVALPAAAEAHAGRGARPIRKHEPSLSRSTAAVAQFNRVALGSTASASNAGDYQFMVVQSTDASEIPALRAANPNLKILLYQEQLLARPSDPTGQTVCTTYPTMSTQDPSWLLANQNGQPIQDKDMADNYLMDVGNPAYQQSCVAHAIALAKADGADGVFWDDVNASDGWYLPSGDTVPEYPTTASWVNAETSFLTYATSQLHADGLLSVGNLGGTSSVPGLWAKWSSILDGSMEQSWNDWTYGGGANVARSFKALLAEPAWSEAHHKYTILESADNGERQNTFGLASMLLVADGLTSYSTANLNQTDDQQWYPTYNAAQKLGAPLGGYRALPNGLYERKFADGIVVVNPTGHARSLKLSRPMVNPTTGRTVKSLRAFSLCGYVLTLH